MQVYANGVINEKEKVKIKSLLHSLIPQLQEAMTLPEFWRTRDSEIRKLRGELDDMLEYSGIPAVAAKHEKLTSEIINLAKKRHQEITGEK